MNEQLADLVKRLTAAGIAKGEHGAILQALGLSPQPPSLTPTTPDGVPDEELS